MLKIIFMGTPDFSVKSLEAIYNAGHKIIGVVTTPDKPKGRGMKMIYTPVKEFAINNSLKLFQPEKIRDNTIFINQIKQLNPDMVCVVSYGKILPKELLDIPRLGCINVHPSLLPKYRGPAPIQWAILNGDRTTGVTTMYLDVGMDTGDMILQKEVEIKANETTGQLWDRLSIIGSELLVETIDKIENNCAPRIRQPESYTIAPMIEKELGNINWEEYSSEKINNLVRGLNPIIGAYSYLEGKKIKFWGIDILNNEQIKELKLSQDKQKPGTILISNDKLGLYIKTKDGIIKVIQLQTENSKKMEAEDFLRGNKLKGIFKMNK